MTDYEVRTRETVVRKEPVIEETYVQREPVMQTQHQVVEDPSAGGRVLVARISGIIWLLFGILNGLIGLRILLKLIAANPTTDFARFVFSVTDPFLAPFNGLVGSPAVNANVFEISAVIAILAYTLLAWVIVRLFKLLFTPARKEQRVTTYRSEV
jgi:YggT family protein